jgi:hypothetical protein
MASVELDGAPVPADPLTPSISHLRATLLAPAATAHPQCLVVAAMVIVEVVLEAYDAVDFRVWPIAEPSSDRLPALSGRMSSAEVGSPDRPGRAALPRHASLLTTTQQHFSGYNVKETASSRAVRSRSHSVSRSERPPNPVSGLRDRQAERQSGGQLLPVLIRPYCVLGRYVLAPATAHPWARP